MTMIKQRNMNELVRILIERDGLSRKKAEEEVMWLSHDVTILGKDPYYVLKEIGLEEDFAKFLH